jgi:hypothetical protein
MQTDITNLERVLGGFSASIDEFIDEVGSVPLSEETALGYRLELLLWRARAIKETGWSLAELSRLVQEHTDNQSVALRCQRLVHLMDALHRKFEGACSTLEQTRRMYLSGMN